MLLYCNKCLSLLVILKYLMMLINSNEFLTTNLGLKLVLSLIMETSLVNTLWEFRNCYALSLLQNVTPQHAVTFISFFTSKFWRIRKQLHWRLDRSFSFFDRRISAVLSGLGSRKMSDRSAAHFVNPPTRSMENWGLCRQYIQQIDTKTRPAF